MLVSDAIRRARRYTGGDRDTLNKADAATAVAETLVLQYDGHVREGVQLEVEATGELMYVWAFDSGTRTATVSRGWDGTTAAAVAQDAVIRVNPRWTHMLDEVADELRKLPGDGLMQMKTQVYTDADWDDDLQGIDVSAIKGDFLGGVYGVEYVFADRKHWGSFRLDENVLWVDFSEADTYTVYYWAAFTSPTSTGDDLETLGLRPSAHDIVAYGVAYRLLAGRATDRIDHETFNGARTAEDVPAEMPTAIARQLMATRQMLLDVEITRQYAEWPARHFIPGRYGRW